MPKAKTTPRERKTIGRVMHEYEHGQLKSGPEGKGGKVKSRRQAIAIALSEAGASKYQSKEENMRLARAKTQGSRRSDRAAGSRGALPCRRTWQRREHAGHGRRESVEIQEG
jgi:hypothetical protein